MLKNRDRFEIIKKSYIAITTLFFEWEGMAHAEFIV